MNNICGQYYKWNRILMTIVGIWPESSKFITLAAQSLVGLSTLSLVIPQYAFLARMCSILDDMIYVIIIQMITGLGVVKCYYFATNMELMRTVINRMYEDHRILESSPAAATIAAYAVRGCWRTQMYTVTMLSACSFFLLSPLTPVILDSLLPLNDSRQKISTFDTDYSIFGINSDEYYYVTVIHGYITGILIMISIIAGDTFMFIVSEHCGGLFEAVGSTAGSQCFSAILQQTYENVSPELRNRSIRDAKNLHYRAISMAELVDSTFTNMYALLVVLNTVLISVTGLETILMMDQPSEMARFFLCAISFAAHLMILSVPSQEILDHSSQLSEAIYASNWMEMSIKDRQLISIMLMRSRKPLCLTAGRFYHIHVENFSQVLKKSFSYFTVLISSR